VDRSGLESQPGARHHQGAQRPIRGRTWSPDSSVVLLVNDDEGDETLLMQGVDVARCTEKRL
jgi:hypothetical protein